MAPIKNSVRWTVVVVGIVYTGILFLSGIQLDSWQKQVLAFLPSLSGAAVVVFDRWLWKVPFVLNWHHRPRLDGLWKTTLIPDSLSRIPAEGNRGPIQTYVIIEQTFWTISVAQFTAESASYSRTSTFIRHGQSSQRTLSFLYDNTPRLEHRQRSPRHVGACELATPQGKPVRVEGLYFTDRFTQGEMLLELVDRSTNYRDFAAAKEHADSFVA